MIAGFDKYYPDRPLFPRRGSAGRPPAGIYAARHGDVVSPTRRWFTGRWRAFWERFFACRRRFSEMPSADDLSPRRCAGSALTNPTCGLKWSCRDLSGALRTRISRRLPRSSKRRPDQSIVAKGKADYSRKHLDEMQEFVKRYGASGLAWIKLGDETTSSLLKVLVEEKIESILKRAGAEKGDAVLIVAGRKSVVAARSAHCAKRSPSAKI